MPKVYKKRSHRSTARRQRFRLKLTFTHFAIAVIIAGILIVGWLSTRQFVRESGPYTVLGKPSISADFINQVLAHYQSSAAGKGQALYNDGLKYGIDPVYALAFFMHESRFGTTGVATVTHSLGNIRATAGYQSYKGYRMYHTWEEGFEDWYQLIAK